MKMDNKIYTFSLVLHHLEKEYSECERVLFDAGCDDALLGMRGGVVYLDFDREEKDFENAVLSAISDVEESSLGGRIAFVGPSNLVTAAEISRRIGHSRESVRLWIEGKRGSGDFPLPVAGVSERKMIYSWLDVSVWLSKEGKLDEEEWRKAKVIVEINDVLKKRESRPAIQILKDSSIKKLEELQLQVG